MKSNILLLSIVLVLYTTINPTFSQQASCSTPQTPTNRINLFNSGLYTPDMTTTTSTSCLSSCWQNSKASSVYLSSGNMCFCSPNTTASGFTSSSNCLSACVGGTGLCGSISDPTIYSSYVVSSKVTNLTSSLISTSTYATSMNSAQIQVAFAIENPTAGSLNATITLTINNFLFIFNSLCNLCTSQNFTSLMDFAGYRTIAATMTDLNGQKWSASTLAAIVQILSSFTTNAPSVITAGQTVTLTYRLPDLYAVNYTAQTTLGTSSSPIMKTKGYTIGQGFIGAPQLTIGFVYLIFAMTITEEVTLMQALIKGNVNEGSLYLQIYRPKCNSGTYCHQTKSCLPAGQICSAKTKIICDKNTQVLKLSSRKCIMNATNAVVSTEPTQPDYSSYYLYFEASMTSQYGDYLVAVNNTDSKLSVTLLPGDIPALYGTATIRNTQQTQNVATKIDTASIANFGTRSTNYVYGIGNPTVVANRADGTPIQTLPALMLRVMKPAYISKTISTSSLTVSYTSVTTVQINSTFANPYSSVINPVLVVVVYPIANVTMTVPARASTFTLVPIILQHSGSLPSCLFTVNDSTSSWVVMGNGTTGTTTVYHYFNTSGTYSITVNVSNFYNWMTAQATVVIITPPADLAVATMALPTGLVNIPMNISVSLSQGSAVNLTIDYGDGTVESAIVDDLNAPTYTSPLDYFVVVPQGWKWTDSSNGTYSSIASLSSFLTICLQSPSCSRADVSPTSNNLYNSPFDAKTFIMVRNSSFTAAYARKDVFNNGSLLRTSSYTWNATSSKNSSASYLSNWTSLASSNQSLQINFLGPVGIFGIYMYLDNDGNYVSNFSVSTSMDMVTWTSYYASNGARTFAGFNSTTRTATVNFDPPVVGRFIKITVLSGSATPGFAFELRGGALTSVNHIFTHTYTTCGIYNVSVTATNAQGTLKSFAINTIDRNPTNLIASLTSPIMRPVNSLISLDVSGTWGPTVLYTATTSDGRTLISNTIVPGVPANTYINYQWYASWSGFYTVTVTVANYFDKTNVTTSYLTIEVPITGIIISGESSTLSQTSGFNVSTLIICVNSSNSDPTGAVYTVDFGDGTSSAPDLFSCTGSAIATCPAQYRFCRSVPSHYYSSSGLKTYVLSVNNNISSTTFSFPYTIWRKVGDVINQVSIGASLPPAVSVFDTCLPAGFPLIFNVTVGTCVGCPANYTYNFGDGSSVVQTTNSTVTHTYASPGYYLVTLNVTNPLSAVSLTQVQTMLNNNYSTLCIMNAFNSSKFQLTTDAPGMINFTTNFSLAVSNPPAGSCYFLDFGDAGAINNTIMFGNLTECQTLPIFSSAYSQSGIFLFSLSDSALSSSLKMNFTHEYPSIGRYTFKLWAGNRVSQISYVLPIVIVELPCSFPAVDMTTPLICTSGLNCNPQYPGIILYTRASTITISSSVVYNCMATNLANYSWTFESCSNAACANNVSYINNIINVYTTKYNTSAPVFAGVEMRSKTFLPRTFEYGIYRVCLNVTMVRVNGLWLLSCGMFSIGPSPIVSCINNGIPAITARYLDVNFVLNASCSSDPDAWPSEPQGLTFEWTCYRPCEAAPKFDSSLRFIPWSSPNNNYSTTCPDKNGTILYNPKGCFQPYSIHVSGPLEYHIASDWQQNSAPTNPLYNNLAMNLDFAAAKSFAWYMQNDSSLQLNTGLMFYQQTHIFMLTTKKTTSPSRISQATAFVRIEESLPPSPTIQCVANCNPLEKSVASDPSYVVFPGEPLKFASVISNFVPTQTYAYRWYIYKVNSTMDSATLLSYISDTTGAQAESYAFSTQCSTSNNKPGVSFDTNLPTFPPKYWDSLIMLVLQITSNGLTGASYVILKINAPPKTEFCSVSASPANGTALQTPFSLSCSCTKDVSSRSVFTYGIGYLVGGKNSFLDFNQMSATAKSCNWLIKESSFCSYPQGALIPPGLASDNYLVSICISVTDDLKSTNYSFIPYITVTQNLTAMTSVLNTLATADLSTALTTNLAGTIGMLTAAASVSGTSSGSSSSNNSSTGLSKTEQAALSANVVNAISSVDYSTAGLSTILQLGNVLSTFTADPTTLTPSSTANAANALSAMAGPLLLASASASASVTELANVASALLSVAAQVSNSIAQQPNSTDTQGTATTMISAIDAVASSIVNKMVIDESPTNFVAGTMTVSLQVKSAASFENAKVRPSSSSSCSRSIFGSTKGLLSKFTNDTPQAAAVKQVNSGVPLRSYLPLSSSMNGDSELSLSKSGTDTKIDTSSLPEESKIMVWIDTGLKTSTVPLPYAENNTLPYTTTDNSMLKHSITMKPNQTMFINVRPYVPDTNSSDIQWPTINETYNSSQVQFTVYITSNNLGPTTTIYEHTCTLPQTDIAELYCGRWTEFDASLAATMSDVSESLSRSTQNWWSLLTSPESTQGERCERISTRARDPWTCMFTPSELNLTSSTTFYIGVKAVAAQVVNVTSSVGGNMSTTAAPPTTTPPVANTGLNNFVSTSYVYFAYPSACYFYNEDIQDYDTAGCYVGSCSSIFATQCVCTHLTSFSSVFQLPQIKFDPSSVNMNALNDSPGVTMFMVGLVCAYCIVWIWARRADLDDRGKVGMLVLPSNEPNDMFGYEITIWTSHVPGSGTSARVSCVIEGDAGETQPRYLYNEGENAFKRGSERSVLLTNPTWLGQLSHIRIWHDNTGPSPSWYLWRVVIRDINTGNKYFFLANAWLAVDKNDGQVDRLLTVAGKNELRNYEYVFWTRSTTELLDGHMWFSVATRPLRSKVTRVQRLTCCLLMSCSAVLFNLLGFIVKNQGATSANSQTASGGQSAGGATQSTASSDTVLFSIGPVAITSFGLTISCLAAVASVPVNLIVFTLFKQRGKKNKKRPEPLDAKYKHDSNLTKSHTVHEKVVMRQPADQQDDEETWLDKFSVWVSKRVQAISDAIFPLPWYSNYIAYVIVLLVVAVSFFCVLVLAYSNLTPAQMDKWLQSILMSLILDVLIIQPVQIIVIVSVFTLLLREPLEAEPAVSTEIVYENVTTNNVKATPPPNIAVVEGLKRRSIKEAMIKSQLMDLIGYFLFLAIVYGAIVLTTPPNEYDQNSIAYFKLQPYQPINSVGEIYAYLYDQYLPYVYGGKFKFANTWTAKPSNSPTIYTLPTRTMTDTADIASVVVSARLRQRRMPPNAPCKVPDLLTTLIPECFGEASPWNTDQNNYMSGWTPLDTSDAYNATAIDGYFSHKSVFNPLYFSAAAIVGTYYAGNGYVANLTNNYTLATQVLLALYNTSWLDEKTRGVFLDFLTYNVQTKLFTFSLTYFAFVPGVDYVPLIYSVDLDPYATASGTLTFLVQMLAVLAITVFAVKTINKAAKKAWDGGWLWLDIAIVVLAVIVVLLVVGTYLSGQSALTYLYKGDALFATLQFGQALRLGSNVLMGVTFLLMAIRLLRFLLFSSTVAVLSSVLLKFGQSMLGIGVMSVIVIVTVAVTVHLLLFSVSGSFSTLNAAITWSFGQLDGKSQGLQILQLHMPNVGLLLYLFYAAFLVFMFTRMPICVLATLLKRTKALHGANNDSDFAYSLVSFLSDWFICGCERTKASLDEDLEFDYIEQCHGAEAALVGLRYKSDDLTKLFTGYAQFEFCGTESLAEINNHGRNHRGLGRIKMA